MASLPVTIYYSIISTRLKVLRTRYLKELADILGGTVGCSEQQIDTNWMPQTSRLRTDRLHRNEIYFACAISDCSAARNNGHERIWAD